MKKQEVEADTIISLPQHWNTEFMYCWLYKFVILFQESFQTILHQIHWNSLSYWGHLHWVEGITKPSHNTTDPSKMCFIHPINCQLPSKHLCG